MGVPQLGGADLHLHTRLLRQLKAAGNGGVIGCHIQQTGYDGPVGAVAGAGGGEGAVEQDLRLHRLRAQQVPCYAAHAHRAGGMRAAWSDHNGSHNIKDVHSLSHLSE